MTGCSSESDCRTKIAAANEGDTVQIASGTMTVSATIDVKKGINIIGAGKNQTIINDAVPKTSGGSPNIFSCSVPNSTALLSIGGFRIQGTSGPIYSGSQGAISVSTVSSTPNVRIHDINFTGLFQRPLVFFGAVWGVIDHCDFTMTNWTGGINIRHANWKNVGDYGDNSWADSPNWGSEQAIFIEDCTFTGFGGSTFIDGDAGMRVVVRHDTITQSEAGNHGTETSQRWRSGRTFEFYQNILDGGPGGCGGPCERGWVLYIRGGSALVWGNTGPTVNGTAGIQRFDSLVKFDEYRLWFKATPWGQADGKNAWDKNYPSVFDSGTATGSSSLTMIDTSKNWSANRWRGYSLLNTAAGTASLISSNTTNSVKYDGNPQGASMSFSAGQGYEIRRVEVVLDGPGRGKGNMINIDSPAWPNEAIEPVRIWGNVLGSTFGNNNGKPIIPAPPTLSSGVDWYYSADNSAALPGYTPYRYPHPLVSGGTPAPTPAPSPTPNVSPTSAPTLPPSPLPTATTTATETPSPTPEVSPTPAVLILQPGQSVLITVPNPTP